MQNTSKRFVTVDAAIFSSVNGKLKVFLKKRDKEPYLGFYELLGGFVKPRETCEEALIRKLKEISDVKIDFRQFAVFSEPSRDPENEVISIGYISLVSEDLAKNLGEFYFMDELPKTSFDHKKIIMHAREYLKKNADFLIKKNSLPELFPLNLLQKTYEAAIGQKIDNRNFRKKMVLSGFVKKTDEFQKSVGHRPAILYRLRL